MNKQYIIEIMEANTGIYLIVLLIALVIWLLPIILFFKVWGMCNDVKRIKEIMVRFEYNNSSPSV